MERYRTPMERYWALMERYWTLMERYFLLKRNANERYPKEKNFGW